MRRITARITWALVAGGLVIAVAVGLIFYHPSGQWRARVLRLKLTGQLPEVSWVDTIAGMSSRRAVLRIHALAGESIRLKARDANKPCPYLWDTPWGDIWGRFEDEPLLETLATEQTVRSPYQNEVVAVREGAVVIDVGSHLGTFTRAALLSGAGQVVAFEPEPMNILCFKQTFEQEILEGRVTLVEAAAWDSSDITLNFGIALPGNTGTGSLIVGGELEVPAVTIDETVERLRLKSVDFIKMDIEGAERNALAGADETLRRFGPQMAICVYHRPDDPEVIPKVVHEARPDYRMVRRGGVAYFLP